MGIKLFIALLTVALIVVSCAKDEGSNKHDSGPGAQGPAGPMGAGITTVKLCPGYVTTYPSSFPEYGLCISNSLYAVYYDGRNAWLAEIVPGKYLSTSTSAPCDFIVSANCAVSP